MREETDRRLAELERRLGNIVRIGVVASLDAAAARARVNLGDFVTAPLPWLTARAGPDRSWWAPEAGEQVVVLSPSGEPAAGVILPALYTLAASAPGDSADVTRTVWGDGLVVEHDRAKKRTRINALDSEGTLILEAKNIVIRTGEGGTYFVDHHGYASRLTHIEAEQFETETWQNGAVFTGLPDNGYTPPEVLIEEEEDE